MSTQLHFRSITLSAWKSVVSIIESLSLLLRVAFLLSGVFRPNANSIWHRVHSKRHTQVPSIIFIAIVSPPSTAPHRLKQLLQLDNRLFFSRIRQSVTRYWHFRLVPHIFYVFFSKFCPLCKPAWPFQAHLQFNQFESSSFIEIYSKVTFSPYILSLSLAPYMHLLHISVVVSASVTKIFQKLLHYARHLPAKWI